jgi:hypothetical protein
MKKILAALLFACSLSLVGCDDTPPNADQVMNQKQEQLSAEANRQTGLPAIKNFNRKKTLKAILEAIDNDKLVNYAYMEAEYSGKLIYLGRCQGYAIPGGTQYTNPQKPEVYRYTGAEYSVVTLPQADPDGLFSPASAEGSWLMLIDPADNTPKATYFEPRVVVSPFPLNPKY